MKKVKMDEMNRLSGEDYKSASKIDLMIVLDNVRSMMNTGSIFRTADAFRVRKIFLCGITATPPHREIEKTALGATESVDWEYHEDCGVLLKSLKDAGVTIAAVEQLDDSILVDKWKHNHEKPLALVFGNEVSGVSDESLKHCDYGLEIPQYGTKHSLNISVSAGIVLWEAYNRLKYQIGVD